MNNFQFFTKELLQEYIVSCRGDANEIAKRRGCSVVTVYGALRDHQLRGMLRAEKMRMLAHDPEAPDYYTLKSRVDDAIHKLRSIACERIAKELGCKLIG